MVLTAELGQTARLAGPGPRRRFDGWFLLVALLAVPTAWYSTLSFPQRMGHGQTLLALDGVRYFAYLPSLLFDGDLQFGNDYVALGLSPAHRTYTVDPGSTGHVPNVFPIGTALLWLPFYGLSHIFALVVRAMGYPFEADGRGPCYQLAALIGTQVYVMLGLLLTYRMLCRRFERGIAALAVCAIYAATFLVWYTTVQAYFSHGPSFFAAALLISLSLRPETTSKGFVGLGLSYGLLISIRPDAAVLAPFPILALLRSARLSDTGATEVERLGSRRWVRRLTDAAWFGGGVLIAMLPQIVVWKVLTGHFEDERLESSFFHFASVPLISVLYSSRNGLFSWSPVVLPSTVGLLALFRRDRGFATASLVSLLAYAYLIAVAADWWGGWAFGARRFGACLPFLAFGLARVLEFLVSRPRLSAGLLLVPLIGQNLLNVELVRRGHAGRDTTLRFARVETERNAISHELFGSWETFPANLLFSLRYGLPADDFDLLWGTHLDRDLNRHLDFDPLHMPHYAGRGWSEPVKLEDGRSVAWIQGAVATILVDLRPVVGPQWWPRRMDIVLSPFPVFRPRDAGRTDVRLDRVQFEVLINGVSTGPRFLENRFGFVTVPVLLAEPLPWTGGVNEVQLLFLGRRAMLPHEAIGFLLEHPEMARELGFTNPALPDLQPYHQFFHPLRAAVDSVVFE